MAGYPIVPTRQGSPASGAASATAVQFPPGFLWGSATAAHQVEGDNRASDWWEFEQDGRVPHRSGEACRQYQLFEQDFDLCRALGQNAHRFSIEWSRIEPVEGAWNAGALAHYRDVIGALTARGLEPIVTLHHFTNPAWFLRRGGWTRRDSPELFARYVEQVARHLGSRVKYWVTVNEPTVYVMQGYLLGVWPPCLSNRWLDAARILNHLARAHLRAFSVLHRHRADAMVGVAHSAPLVVPCNPRRPGDRMAAAIRDFALNRAFFRLIGARGPGSRARARALDFIGINYYTRNCIRSTGWGLGALFGRACGLPHHGGDGPLSAVGWEVYPDGLSSVLERFSAYGLPLIVTENGIATADETLRRDFLLRHVARVGDAVTNGVNVIGYLYWSLIDNFEWAAGTSPRFGLAAVDYSTQERTIRPAAREFAHICRANGMPGAGDDGS